MTPGGPSSVYAGNRRITDLGTKFSVFRNGDDVRVTVREGRVQVDMLDRPAVARRWWLTRAMQVMPRAARLW